MPGKRRHAAFVYFSLGWIWQKSGSWKHGPEVWQKGGAKSGLEGVCFRICCAYESIKLSSFKGCALELPFLLQFRS